MDYQNVMAVGTCYGQNLYLGLGVYIKLLLLNEWKI